MILIQPKAAIVLFVLLMVFVQGMGQNQNFDSNLPIVHLNTNGNPIMDEPRIEAEMGIIWNESGINNPFDPISHFEGDIKIEIRGSSSQMFDKKSFALELKDELGQDMDFPILGMPPEEDWILYAPYSDKTLIRNVLTFSLASQFSSVYVPRCRFVELFVNKEYEGVYVLMENIKRDSVRVDIANLKPEDISGKELTGGYIIKVDKTTGGGGEGWYSSFTNNNSGARTYYQYEYPKSKEIHQKQKEYIKNYIDAFEEAMRNNDFHPETGYSSFIHKESFMDYMIMNEITKNVDGYRLSTFLHKEKNGKLKAGPIWDFNLGYGNANYYDGWSSYGLQVIEDLGQDRWQNPFWWNTMLSDLQYSHDLKCRWDSLRSTVLSDQRIDEVTDSLVNLLTDAKDRNFDRWPVINQWVWPNYYVGESYWKEVFWLKDWLDERMRWLDFALPGKCSEEGLPTPPITFSFSVYPNPFSSKLNLNIHSESNLTYRLELFNNLGQKVFEMEMPVGRGNNNFSIDAENMKGGIYIYRLLKGSSEVSVGKMVKVH